MGFRKADLGVYLLNEPEEVVAIAEKWKEIG